MPGPIGFHNKSEHATRTTRTTHDTHDTHDTRKALQIVYKNVVGFGCTAAIEGGQEPGEEVAHNVRWGEGEETVGAAVGLWEDGLETGEAHKLGLVDVVAALVGREHLVHHPRLYASVGIGRPNVAQVGASRHCGGWGALRFSFKKRTINKMK